MIQANLTHVMEFMRKHNFVVELQKETNQIFTILNIAQQEYPLFIRMFEASQLMQLLVFIPTKLSSPTSIDSARLLHLLNKEVDMPGFGMDEMAHVIFYRLMIPVYKKHVDEEIFLNYLKAIQNICELFAIPVQAVANGDATLDEILEKVRESQQEVQN